jgi:uncharacterized protein YecE (DUF72 family)
LSVHIGCSGWSYPDSIGKGGWMRIFYPNTRTKKLEFYSQFFNTVEMDATFYEKFYKYMTKETFISISMATPPNFQFSLKVPESITHDKSLDVNKGAINTLEEFLEKISPLKTVNKLGTIIIQLPPSFTVKHFKNIEEFLDRLLSGYDFAVEFRHPSWDTEGPWDLLKHYNVAAVMTYSPQEDKLQFLSEVIVTANHSFIRWHGRDAKHRYNYLYSKQELSPWVNKIKKISLETSVVRGYFNNHYGAKAIVNGLEFRELLGESLSKRENEIREKINDFYRSKQLVLDNIDVKSNLIDT